MATITTIHDMGADVLLLIFEYFTVNEIYEIFSELIPYLTSLLINSHIRLHLRKTIFTQVDPTQIISLDLSCLPEISSSSIINFTNLRSLILHDIENPQVLVNQSLFQSLEILYLKISLKNKPVSALRLLPLLTQLPKLKSYTLIYPSSYFILKNNFLILPKSSNTVKNIKLDLNCSIDCFKKLFQRLPCLNRLETNIKFIQEDNINLSKNLLFPSIKYLILSWNDYIPFRYIIKFCKKMINLKECTFNVTNHGNDRNVFNPRIWRQFIEHDHVFLKKLVVYMKHPPTYGHYRIHGGRDPFIDDPYFQSINFNLKYDHWDNIALVGNYVKPT